MITFWMFFSASFISTIIAWAGGFIGGKLTVIANQLEEINDKLDE